MSFLPAPVVGVVAGLLFFINIMLLASLIVIAGIIKFFVPFKSGKNFIERVQNDVIPSVWTDINSLLLKLGGKTKWVVEGEGNLDFNHWYFVFANHQTWADIVVMQKIFNRKIRLIKFFLKQELLWTLPMGGLACYMLDFPFMKRHNKAYLRKHPEKKNADLEATKASCEKFKQRPTTVMNFLEGTRFTVEKQRDRSSPYKYLLRPKSGGVALVVSELKDYIKEVVDVTIIYSHPRPTFWKFISGQIPKITVKYRVIPLDHSLYGDYYNDPVFRRHFQSWLNTIWQNKNNLIETTLAEELKP
ncbi:MAG: acyltransferase [Gammaproteobacteria bacterium]|nr:acyltransferase [Gammaproteobacteria bacterium]